MALTGINLINKCRSIIIDGRHSITSELPDMMPDQFVKSSPKVKFTKKVIEDLTPEKHRLHNQQLSIQHEKRLKKFFTEDKLVPKEVDEKTFQLLYDIQYESSEYSGVLKKLRKGEVLTDAEQKFLEDAKKLAKPCSEDTILWRSLTPYDGFEDEINNGVHNLNSLTSTNKFYDEFFSFWSRIGIHSKGEKFYGVKPVYLKIKVPKGTPVLDCNATHMGKNLRMNSETVLLPGKCSVDSIDNELDVIEMTYKMD